ncbi:hypothetical protein QBC36DRAFT_364002 [Triangularia setosa]|uniref:Uncharacterized protein n=1 Tax=Triangularia setosa TaxID=2587417 RepID=A0AAN6VYD2_9PEZI|nr:hypothetical protein QBC36DRAFT_364002 [Podospora setosa]
MANAASDASLGGAGHPRSDSNFRVKIECESECVWRRQASSKLIGPAFCFPFDWGLLPISSRSAGVGNATPHSAGADVAELPVDATAMPFAPRPKDARRAFYVVELERRSRDCERNSVVHSRSALRSRVYNQMEIIAFPCARAVALSQAKTAVCHSLTVRTAPSGAVRRKRGRVQFPENQSTAGGGRWGRCQKLADTADTADRQTKLTVCRTAEWMQVPDRGIEYSPLPKLNELPRVEQRQTRHMNVEGYEELPYLMDNTAPSSPAGPVRKTPNPIAPPTPTGPAPSATTRTFATFTLLGPLLPIFLMLRQAQLVPIRASRGPVFRLPEMRPSLMSARALSLQVPLHSPLGTLGSGQETSLAFIPLHPPILAP